MLATPLLQPFRTSQDHRSETRELHLCPCHRLSRHNRHKYLFLVAFRLNSFCCLTLYIMFYRTTISVMISLVNVQLDILSITNRTLYRLDRNQTICSRERPTVLKMRRHSHAGGCPMSQALHLRLHHHSAGNLEFFCPIPDRHKCVFCSQGLFLVLAVGFLVLNSGVIPNGS